MHPSLEIEEILRCILEFVYGDHQKPQRRSAVNLAVTCRTFLRPALECSWFCLPSLALLLMCLPEDAWRIEEKLGYPTLFLERTLVTEDWKRLQFYVPFVKSLKFSSYAALSSNFSSKLPGVDAGVFRALRTYMPNTPILPNLRILDCKPGEYIGFDLGPFLTTNLLEISLPSSSLPATLVHLKQISNRLRKLHIYDSISWDPSRLEMTPLISNLVVHLPSLECVSSTIPLTDNAIAWLSTLPNLKKLTIPNDATDFLHALETNAPPFFSNLVEFTVDVDILTSLLPLLMLCRLRNLQRLRVRAAMDISQVHDAERLFVELANSCSHDVLESIRLDDFNCFDLPMPAHALKHLFVFRRLRDISLGLSFDLDDEMVEQMAISWPRLQNLHMHFPVRRRNHPQITLRGLVSLVTHCRDLDAATLVLHVSCHDLVSLRKGIEGLQNYRFTYLSLVEAWIDDDVEPARVSSFLNVLLPKLAVVDLGERRQKSAWDEISRHLNAGVKGWRMADAA